MPPGEGVVDFNVGQDNRGRFINSRGVIETILFLAALLLTSQGGVLRAARLPMSTSRCCLPSGSTENKLVLIASTTGKYAEDARLRGGKGTLRLWPK